MRGDIRAEMLGGLTVLSGGLPVFEGESPVPAPWRAFACLALARPQPVDTGVLAAALWMEADPAGAAARVAPVIGQLNAALGLAGDAVVPAQGGYAFAPGIAVETDAEDFEAWVKVAGDAVGDAALDTLGRAVELYGGDLLPDFAAAPWVAVPARHYRSLYQDAARRLCEGLYAAGRSGELLQAAATANQLDPLDEGFALYLFRALDAMEMYRAIIPAYSRTQAAFGGRLGAPLPAEIERIYARACERIDPYERDMLTIRDELRQAATAAPGAGPLLCSYEVFKYLYQMVARSSERSGASVVVLLLTLAPTGEIGPRTLAEEMNRVQGGILGGLLRKSDTVARYSERQFIIMLSVERAQSAQVVVERIRARCQPALEGSGIRLEFTTAELEAPL